MKIIDFVGLSLLLTTCGDLKSSSNLNGTVPTDPIKFTKVASFAVPGGASGRDPDMIDLDGDGVPDIVYDTKTVLLNKDFTAKKVSTSRLSQCSDCFAFFADVDGDHVFEMLKRDSLHNSQEMYSLNKNTGNFEWHGSRSMRPVSGNVKAIIPDLNGDSVAEIVTQPGLNPVAQPDLNDFHPEQCSRATVPTYLGLSQPGKIYSSESMMCKLPGIFADINYDGYPDIFYMVNNGTAPSISLWDKNTPTYSKEIEIKFDVAPYESGYIQRYIQKEFVKLVDVDHNGSLDVIIVRLYNDPDKLEVLTYKQGHAVGEYKLFAKQTLNTTASWRPLRREGNVGIEDVSIVDFNGDGFKDLVVRTYHSYRTEDVEIHPGNSGQQFSVDYKLTEFQDQVKRDFSLDSFVDFDHDGRLDYISVGGNLYNDQFGRLVRGTLYTLWHQE